MSKAVLLLDDDPEFRLLVKPFLEAKGMVVFEAEDGGKASALIARQEFDLLIVDGVLPDIEGEALIAGWSNNKTPVVYISSRWVDAPKFVRLVNDLQVKLVVQKPVLPLAFAHQIESIFQPDPQHKLRRRSNLAATLIELRKGYNKEIPRLIAELSQVLQDLQKKNAHPLLVQDAMCRAHKFSGTSGSYGHLELSAVLSDMESTLSFLLEPQRAESALWSALDSMLDKARALSGEEQLERVLLPVQTSNRDSLFSGVLLLVDDDPETLEMAKQIGQSRLIQILEARSPQEAEQHAKSSRVDALFFNSSIVNNYESIDHMVQKFRAMPGCENAPLAFISDQADIKSKISAAEAGASLFLEKPVSKDNLDAAIQQMIGVANRLKSRVLILDDDDDFAKHAAGILSHAGIVVQCSNQPIVILDTLEEFRPDLLLVDIRMPGVSGLEITRMLRTVPKWQDLPIILITAYNEHDVRVFAFQCGCDDYLVKGFVPQELIARVSMRIDRARLLRERAENDSLTGLYLRRAFLKHFSDMLSESKRHGWPLTIALVDIDHFKKVNDTYGHLAGDTVVIGLANLLKRRFRPEDLRARWGGDEFILAFRKENIENVSRIISRTFEEFSSIRFHGDNGESFTVGNSCGLACYPEDGASLEELIRTADIRLYDSKSAGRGCVTHR